MIERIFSYDPGKTTGYASLGIFDDYLEPQMWIGQFEYNHRDIEFEIEKANGEWFNINHDHCLVIIENYIITTGNKIKHMPEPLKIIGVIEYLLHDIECVLMPSAKKEYANNNMLKAYHYYKKGVPHGLDAARHIITFLTEQTNKTKYKFHPKIKKWIKEGQLKYLEGL